MAKMNTKADGEYDHALNDICNRLNHERGSKAAVFVGAGFSCNAISTSSGRDRFPLWNELTAGLAARLYPRKHDRDRVLAQAGATSSAMRLAQEFETAFGRPALIEFVRDMIPDDAFAPGTLHRKLLELRWADVFTTNYDRLLERAKGTISRDYDVVYNIGDLPLALCARIIKLHGSLPDLSNLVLTEEDFRKYPRRYAAFVTAVQAALTENVLCLIGFSGDDPNFLAWTGWLRDELQSAVPKTYLFTGHELKPFQRQLLEERHIVAIPIMQIAKANSFAEAYHWLFTRLATRPEAPLPPWNVGPQYANPKHDERFATEPSWPDRDDWIDTAIVWRSNRQQYRGWYVLYREGAERLTDATELWIGRLTAATVEAWPEPTALFVLRELVWRWSTALRPLDDNLVFNVIDPQLKRFAIWRETLDETVLSIRGRNDSLDLSMSELDDAYEMLLRECLRHAREIGNDNRFRSFTTQLDSLALTAPAGVVNDRHAYVRYQHLLQLLGRLQHRAARQQLESWDTSRVEIIWSIRRAGLCLEMGLVDLGSRLLESALERLRSVPVSPLLDPRQMSAEGITLYLLWCTDAARNWNVVHSPDVDDSMPDEHRAGPIAASDSLSDSFVEMREDQRERLWEQHSDNRGIGPSPPFTEVKGRPAPKAIIDRLNELRKYGCDPNEFREWLEEAPSTEPCATKGTFQHEGFDIGVVQEFSSLGAEPQAQSAYQAMRFIEDAGLPLQIASSISTTVAANLFRAAVRTIAFFAPHEAAGTVLRSRDEKTVELIFSRQGLARLSKDQIDSLLSAGVQAIDDSMRHLKPVPRQREPEDTFWDEQFNIGCVALSRLVVRCQDDQISKILLRMVKLPHDPRILERWQSQDCVATCIRRAAGSLSRASILNLLPTLLSTPVPGSAQFPAQSDGASKWHDPLGVVADFVWGPRPTAVLPLDDQIEVMLARIASAVAEERVNLCRRAADLLAANLLSEKHKEMLVSSLFTRPDEYGLPADTGCFDTLILLLPRMRGINEVDAFRQKHLQSVAANPSTWANLRRTRSPFRQFRSNPARNLNWTTKDLTLLLDRADFWLATA